MAVDLPLGWMRQIIGAFGTRRPLQSSDCIGHFYDNARKLKVVVNLGAVFVRCPFSFRPAPDQDEPLNVLSWDSGAAQNDEIPFFKDEKFQSGSYVIPGLTAMGRKNHVN